MSVRVGINGFGRVGRSVYRAARERGDGLEIVAVNDLADAATLAHPLRYDSVFGRFEARVETRHGLIVVDGDPMEVLNEPDPVGSPWRRWGSTR